MGAVGDSSGDRARVEAALRVDITRNEFSPNEHLIEADLAGRYATNRGTIRAVLAALAKEGLIEQVPRRGARVRLVELDEAIEITEIRLAAEAICAAKAAERASPSELRELASLVERMKEPVAVADIMHYHELVREVHDRICRFSGHTVGVRVAEQMRNQSIRHLLREAMVRGRLASSYEEHVAIVEAIVARDPAAAEAAVRQHRLGAVEALRAVRARRESQTSREEPLLSS